MNQHVCTTAPTVCTSRGHHPAWFNEKQTLLMWIQHMSSLIKGNILSHQCFLSWILLKDKILCCSQLGPGGSPARPRRDLQAFTPGCCGPSGEFANCRGVLPKKNSWGSSWGHKIVPFVHQWNTRCFGETKLLTGHHRLLSLTDFNSKGAYFEANTYQLWN